MHIPDGFLSPTTCAVGYALLLPLAAVTLSKSRQTLRSATIPALSALSALSFVIMMVNVPIPGGTSGHAVGAAFLAILAGPWLAGLAISIVLAIQALLFGDGGVTSWGWNALGMGYLGSALLGTLLSALAIAAVRLWPRRA